MADNKFSQSIMTLLIGMLMSIIAFLILGYNEGLFYDQNIIRWLPMIESEELLRESEGMVKLNGVPEVKTELKAPENDENLLFIKRVYEEMIDDEWVRVRTDEAWANFSIFGVEVMPEHAIQFFDLEKLYEKETNGDRQTMFGFAAENPLIVVGEIKNNTISGGDTFAISNKSNDVLEAQLKAAIHSNWWLYKLFSLILLSVGIIAFLLPLLAFLEILQEVGFWGVLTFIGASIGLALLLIAIETLVFAYWFLIFLVLGVMAYLFIRIFIKKKRKPINVLPN